MPIVLQASHCLVKDLLHTGLATCDGTRTHTRRAAQRARATLNEAGRTPLDVRSTAVYLPRSSDFSSCLALSGSRRLNLFHPSIFCLLRYHDRTNLLACGGMALEAEDDSSLSNMHIHVSSFDERSAELCNVAVCVCLSGQSRSLVACCSESTSTRVADRWPCVERTGICHAQSGHAQRYVAGTSANRRLCDPHVWIQK